MTAQDDKSLTILLEENPRFHAQFGQDNAIIVKAVNHSLSRPFLHWLYRNVETGARTVETGCGYSSVVFSMKQARHFVISPFSEEHTAIMEWCSDHGISIEQTQFIANRSQAVLPQMTEGEWDLILIDGDHAFPGPFIDWYYTVDRLKQGGRLIVDDTHLVTGQILRDFLRMERGRWQLEEEIDKTAIFRKISQGPVTDVEWFGLQPFCGKRERSFLRRVGRKAARAMVHRDDALFWA